MTKNEMERIDSPLRAAELLMAGKLVAFPTETVFGLGVDATNQAAVERLFAAKGRPSNNPLIVHVADIKQIHAVSSSVPQLAIELLARFAPGPLTVVVPKHPSIVPAVTAGWKVSVCAYRIIRRRSTCCEPVTGRSLRQAPIDPASLAPRPWPVLSKTSKEPSMVCC